MGKLRKFGKSWAHRDPLGSIKVLSRRRKDELRINQQLIEAFRGFFFRRALQLSFGAVCIWRAGRLPEESLL